MSAPTTLRPVDLIPSPAAHPLTALLRAAARRALPPVDGTVAARPAPSGTQRRRRRPVVLQSAAADVAPEWVSEHVPVGEGRRGGAAVLAALADRLGVPTPGVDVLLVARKPRRPDRAQP